jgi:hypothetical protein
MSKLYVNQPISIEIECIVTGGSMATATSADINYLKPNGCQDAWTGVVNTVTGIVSYNAPSAEIDVNGIWRLQPVVAFASGSVLPGETVEMTISERFT